MITKLNTEGSKRLIAYIIIALGIAYVGNYPQVNKCTHCNSRCAANSLLFVVVWLIVNKAEVHAALGCRTLSVRH